MSQTLRETAAIRLVLQFPLLRPFAICFALLSAMILPAVARAQSATGQGTITGQVVDPRGAVVVGAAVTITNNDTKVENVSKTNGSGVFTVESLVPGTYTVKIDHPGFKDLNTTNVIVSAGSQVPLNAKLEIGGSSETVTVQASSELLSTTSDVSTTVDTKIVENLPYPERSSLEAVLLVPGVTGDSLSPGGITTENPGATTQYFSPGASISIGGAPPGTAAIIVDGSDVTEASFPRAGVNLSGQIVQETTVVVAGASAQYGRTAGGVIVQSSRGGTSQYHGGVTWRHTDPFFWTITPGQFGAGNVPSKTDDHEQFYGFYLGGPVRIPKVFHGDDRTFFFVGVEPARIHELNGAVRGQFLTPAELSGQFHNSVDILNTTVLKNFGYAAALSVPRIGGVGYTTPCGGAGYTTNCGGGGTNPTTACSADKSGLFPCGIVSGTSSTFRQITGPLSDCTNAGITQADFSGGTSVCHDDLAPELALNPFAQFVISQLPTPSNPGPYVTFDNAQGTTATDLTNGSYRRGVNNTDNRYSIRIDHQFNNNNQINVRYTTVPVNAARVFAVAPTNPLDQTPTDVEHGYDVSVAYTRVFTSNVVNNAHYSWFRENLQRLPPLSTTSTDFGAKYGLTPAILGYGFPSLGAFSSSTASYIITPGGSGYSQQVDQNFILGDDLTWTHGPHAISIGFDYRWIQSNQYDLSGVAGGKYGFSYAQSEAPNGQPAAAGYTGQYGAIPAQPVVGGGSGFGSFILGIQSGAYSNTPVEVPGYYRYKYWAVYFQDNWRATSKLTLNLGLRYEVQVPRTEAKNNQGYVSTVPIAGTLNGFATSTAFCFSGACGLQRSLWPTNWFGIEPRIGIAYAATPKTTIRASYSITRPPLSGLENIPDPDFNLSGSSTGVISAYQQDYISNPVQPSSLISSYTTLNGRGPFNFSTGVAPVFVDQNNRVPNVQIANVTFQYQPFSKTLTQVTYQHTRGEHLYSQFVAENTPQLSTLVTAIQSNAYLGATFPNNYNILTTNNASGSVISENGAQALEPFQNFFNQGLTDIYPRDGDSHYDALYLSVNQRATKTLTLLSNYVWSKSLDNVPDVNGGANAGYGTTSLQTPFSLRQEYSVSSYDQDSAFKAGYNLDLPFGIGQHYATGNGFIDRLIGNFSTAGFLTWETGFPNFVTLGNAGYFYSVVPKGVGATLPGNPNSNVYACSAANSSNFCSTSVLPSGYTLRPNIVPGVPLINKNWRTNPYNSLAGITPYLNSNAFAVPGAPGAPALGNAPRTLSDARSPRALYFDANVIKGFTLRERYRVNLQVQLNNALNHPNYYGAATPSPAFAAVTTNNNASSASGVINPTIQTATFGNLQKGGAAVMSRVIRVGASITF